MDQSGLISLSACCLVVMCLPVKVHHLVLGWNVYTFNTYRDICGSGGGEVPHWSEDQGFHPQPCSQHVKTVSGKILNPKSPRAESWRHSHLWVSAGEWLPLHGMNAGQRVTVPGIGKCFHELTDSKRAECSKCEPMWPCDQVSQVTSWSRLHDFRADLIKIHSFVPN